MNAGSGNVSQIITTFHDNGYGNTNGIDDNDVGVRGEVINEFVGSNGGNNLIESENYSEIRWDCHLHRQSTCSMCFSNGVFYHIVQVKVLSQYATIFNMRNREGEFWESFQTVLYISPIACITYLKYQKFLTKIFGLFNTMDENGILYSRYNTPEDFVKRHMIVNSNGAITLCNRHLLVQRKQPKPYYSTKCWRKKIVRALYPGVNNNKRKVSSDNPSWIYALLGQI